MIIFHIFSYKSLASGTLILEIIDIADNKLVNFCYRCSNILFQVFPSTYNIKMQQNLCKTATFKKHK